MGALFGTDGVRGIPGRYPLTPAALRAIAFSAGKILAEKAARGARAPAVLMGRDTRESGPSLARDLAAGFAAAGCRIQDVGVIPTPGISCLIPRVGAAGGAVVSASHNPARFNGVKFFDAAGFKLGAEAEGRIEREASEPARAVRARRSAGAPQRRPDLAGLYIDFLRSTFPSHLDLSGMTIALDCANGAAAKIAPALFSDLGAKVAPLGVSPDGRNINAGCGALFPGAVRRTVLRRKADCGISFDGDADRALFTDEKGRLLDGDAIICLAALRLKRQGLLRKNKVALTVMSNYALLRFLESQGIASVCVPVGDRNVTDAIEKEGLSLGGETSGHVIFRRFAATGDGLLTALQTLAALRESGGPLSALGRAFRAVPQVMENVETDSKIPLEDLPRLQKVLRRGEKELRGRGRILLRYSGTEPVLRILAEGPSKARVRALARSLAETYRRETGQEGEKQ
ncbi:MAG TPA: phosphoglucosamine mutase [Elusimicrobiota bacterium]|nr:phosphoglucosamine mutase [Elusimicrobiota bacterium]